MTSILKVLCDAQDRYANAAGIVPFTEIGSEDVKTDPRDGLLNALWMILDADSTIVLRMGEAPSTIVDMSTQASLVGDVLTLGEVVIDLSTATVAYVDQSPRTTQFLIDGTPLRFTYAAGHVDGNIESYDSIQSMVRDVKDGSIPGIMMSIDGTDTVLGPDDVSLSEGDEDYGDPILGDLMTYSCLNGPLLNGRGEGPIEGLDFLGRHIRIERMGQEAEMRIAA